MPKSNPMNPKSQDPEEVARFSPMAVARGTVTAVQGRQDTDGAYHTATVRIYGDPSPYTAVVLSPSRGDVNVPTQGDDVAVAFGPNEQPYIIGFWYAADKVDDGRVNLPDYKPGERIIGTPLNDSVIAIRKDGHIQITTEGSARVDIDHQSATAYRGSTQSIAGDDQYYRIDYDTVEDDPEGMLGSTPGQFTVLADGTYEMKGAAEIAAAGQNNRYTMALFVNGTEVRRKSRQSAVNEPLSLDVEGHKRLDEGDTVEVHIKQNSGSSKTITGELAATQAAIVRQGI